jgi:hypothetical protein
MSQRTNEFGVSNEMTPGHRPTDDSTFDNMVSNNGSTLLNKTAICPLSRYSHTGIAGLHTITAVQITCLQGARFTQ